MVSPLATSHDHAERGARRDQTLAAWAELSDHERQIVRLLAWGFDAPTIAGQVRRRPQTIRRTISGILAVFGCETSLRLVALHGATLQQL